MSALRQATFSLLTLAPFAAGLPPAKVTGVTLSGVEYFSSHAECAGLSNASTSASWPLKSCYQDASAAIYTYSGFYLRYDLGDVTPQKPTSAALRFHATPLISSVAGVSNITITTFTNSSWADQWHHQGEHAQSLQNTECKPLLQAAEPWPSADTPACKGLRIKIPFHGETMDQTSDVTPFLECALQRGTGSLPLAFAVEVVPSTSSEGCNAQVPLINWAELDVVFDVMV